MGLLRPAALIIPLILLCIMVLSGPLLVRAEGGTCPDGYFPTGGGTAGWVGCAPMDPFGGGNEEGQEEEAPADTGGGEDGMSMAIGGFVGILSAMTEEIDRLANPADPAVANGAWEVVGSLQKPGDYCSAIFTQRGVGMAMMGPGGSYDGAFLMLFGANIPHPPALTKILVTLNQSDSAPQTVHAFNMAMPGANDYGAVIFVVPSAEAAIEGMTDTLALDVVHQGQPIVGVAYHDGAAAREQLRQCIARRQ